MLFEQDSTSVLVEILPGGDEIELRSRGPENKALLSVISSDLEVLNDSFNGLRDKVDKRIPCNCSACRAVMSPGFFGHRDMVRRKEHGRLQVECPLSFENVDVLHLLDGIKAESLPTWANDEPQTMSKSSSVSGPSKRNKYENQNPPWSAFHPRPTVFISYRRDGGGDLAARVRDGLKDRGFSVFMDVEDLKSGMFDETLLGIIEGVTDVIVILTPGCLGRCSDEDDWFRREIRHAIGCERNVVPILARGFQMPPSGALPPDIADLPRYNGLTPAHELFDASMERLVSTFLKSRRTE